MEGTGSILAMMILLLMCQPTETSSVCTERVCRYRMVVRRQMTMTYRHEGLTYDVRLNGSDLRVVENSLKIAEEYPLIGEKVPTEDVITADGYRRTIITINGQFPGPTIEVMQGSMVEVEVLNKLWTEAITVHWHGLSLRGNNWMDGVPHVTQCPIPPDQKFTYRFTADNAGTRWYHSHIANQRLDGLFGMMVIHKVAPASPEFPVVLMDWLHVDATTLHVINPYDRENIGSGDNYLRVEDRYFSEDNVELSAFRFSSGLINGRGRKRPSDLLPLTRFEVSPEKTHLFRVVHSGAEYTFEISVDAHDLIVVASDGNGIQPQRVHSIIIFPGERVDFSLVANQSPGLYWFRAKIMHSGRYRGPQSKFADWPPPDVKAIVRYKGIPDDKDPHSSDRRCTPHEQCTVFNCPFKDYSIHRNKKCITFDLATSLNTHLFHENYGLKDSDADVEDYFFNFAFTVGSSINSRQFINPSVPLCDGYTSNGIVPCDENECSSKGCRCTNVVDLPYNKTVQMVLSGLHPNFHHVAHHSVHLHGHGFAVVKMGFPDFNRTTGHWTRANTDIRCESALCALPSWTTHRPGGFNLIDPPVKDTVVVPARGYIVIRFRTNNPGWWMFHCHQELHQMEGMSLLFNEAFSKHRLAPTSLPRCSEFDWTVEEFDSYLRGTKKSISSSSSGQPNHGTERRSLVTMKGAGDVGVSHVVLAIALILVVMLMLVVIYLLVKLKRVPGPRTGDHYAYRYGPIATEDHQSSILRDRSRDQTVDVDHHKADDTPPTVGARRRSNCKEPARRPRTNTM